jgi:NADH:flavin oxidoreductase / NADH oxidase family
MSVLFTPFQVGALGLANRVVIAPMCQYSAVSGCMTDWHLIHLGHLALSGAALLTIEATAVLPEGRITYADVGLWNEATEAAIVRTLESIRRWSDMRIAIRLADAGLWQRCAPTAGDSRPAAGTYHNAPSGARRDQLTNAALCRPVRLNCNPPLPNSICSRILPGTLPAGFIAPCVPTKKPISCSQSGITAWPRSGRLGLRTLPTESTD